MHVLGKVAVMAAALAVVAACAGGTSAGPTPTEQRASTFDEFVTENCAAAQALFRGYGNPDTAGLSDLMQDFEAAIDRGDKTAATAKAGELKSMFEDGRGHARAAAGWAPAATAMLHLDGMLQSMIRLVDAELAGIDQGLAAAKQAGQAAFEAESAAEDWFGWLQGLGAVLSEAGVTDLPACEDVPF